VSGSAPEQPVPRKISDDDDDGTGGTDAAVPPAGAAAGSGPIDPWTLGWASRGERTFGVGADLGLASALVLLRSSLLGLFIAGAGRRWRESFCFPSHLLLTAPSLVSAT
jgi:hypothetical protein